MSRQSINKRLGEWLGASAIFVVIILFWEWAVSSGAISELAFPRPFSVISEGGSLLTDKSYWSAWTFTLGGWSVAMVSALVTGLMLGFIIGTSRAVGIVLMPLLSYLRAIPPIALFPLALVAIGPGGVPIAIVAALTGILYIVPGTAAGAEEITVRYNDMRRVLQISMAQWLKTFVAPGTLYHALAAARIAATAAFAVTVAGEIVIGGSRGIGAAILELSEGYQLEDAYFYVVSSGLVGLGIDLTFRRLASEMAQRAS